MSENCVVSSGAPPPPVRPWVSFPFSFLYRTLVLGLVTKLVKDHGDIAVPALTTSLHEVFLPWTTIVATRPNAKIAMAALQWISVIVVNAVG